MAKRTSTTDQSPLSHYWTPPAVAIEGGLGEPWACLATTFEFDAEFFETELLPRFLGLKSDHTENEPSFLVEREEALALARVSVLVDHSRLDSSQTTLRWDQVQIQIPGGIQHAKITILAWEHLIRVMIGSANLKRIAYRRNREMFAALDFWNDPKSAPLRLIHDVLDVVTLMVGWSRASEAAVERTRETVDRLRRLSRRWDDAPSEFSPRERPRAAVAVTHPRADRRPARSTLDEVVQLWGHRRATSITVVTPFAAPEPDPKVGDIVVNKLAGIRMTRECEGWLVIPELPKVPEDQRTRVPFPQVLKESWKATFGKRGGAYVLPLPLCVEGKEIRNRTLHSKSIVLESEHDDVAMMMIGSSNFTPRGMGVGIHNFEANLVFEDVGSVRRSGLRLVDRLGLPRSWDEGLELDEAVWQTPEEPQEDEPDPIPVLHAFFAWATFSQVTGTLTLGLDRRRDQPKSWSVRLPGSDVDAPRLFARHSDVADPSSGTLTHVLLEAMHTANIVALLVEWQDDVGELQQAKLGVTAEGDEHLLPPEQFQTLNADAIIDCLISGKTPSQWVDKYIGNNQSSAENDAAAESLRSVDTSSFLLYRVRRFGRALTGMSQRITNTIPHADAIRYRMLKDPFGPIPLAHSITGAAKDHNSGWCATLDDGHRLFLIAEILLTVVHLETRLARKSKGKERKAIKDIFGVATHQLQQCAESIELRDRLPGNLLDYLARVRTLAEATTGGVTDAMHVD